ncbi:MULTISPECIES: universal stress protein [unclassified Streptomyces]|uniref:universal stress protein n=1 Tax=unclassified Streptomyces TaxID=2593676 RepID=UPI002E77EC66|nr:MULTISPECIES: universal stress protein [unclassified Streptomyces]MEE1760997.1 universal stress protein [Streptomyces sp. SP18BB07]MEE1836151.1 universal stress protein [Streptomyces sp. SP17KL33]
MGNLVVVGVDGSSESLAAVDEAAREAWRRRAELRVVYAFDGPARPLYAPLDPAPLRDLVKEAARRAKSVAPQLEVSEAVMTGEVAAVLEAESRTADLLVVGSHGTGGFIGMLVGSKAVTLAAYGHCPVMVVRGEEPDPARPVVLAVDGSPMGEKAVDFAFAEASLRGAELVGVHAWLPDYAPPGTGTESAERLLAQALVGHAEQYPDVMVRHDVISGEVREVLIETSRTAQLMVVGARGRGGFLGLLLGSVSQALLHHAHSPVAVVRGKD